jgi:hypothetical protein
MDMLKPMTIEQKPDHMSSVPGINSPKNDLTVDTGGSHLLGLRRLFSKQFSVNLLGWLNLD